MLTQFQIDRIEILAHLNIKRGQTHDSRQCELIVMLAAKILADTGLSLSEYLMPRMPNVNSLPIYSGADSTYADKLYPDSVKQA